ncbi:MAG: group III truncated hemoglobin [Flavobacteriaceae bacterium]|nr:group III truncated hemoglobin [Flavobacteriaceae bacterium]
MKEDIADRSDIRLFVEAFYDKLLTDSDLRHYFSHILEQNTLEKHLETITDFWEDILFLSSKYDRNAMKPHLGLNQRMPFEAHHFKAWLGHFNTTIDQYFNGDKVRLAKNRALSIATIMQIKIKN